MLNLRALLLLRLVKESAESAANPYYISSPSPSPPPPSPPKAAKPAKKTTQKAAKVTKETSAGFVSYSLDALTALPFFEKYQAQKKGKIQSKKSMRIRIQ